MKVIPTGDILCYRVQSESNEQDYLVDLSCYGGNGKCECMDFRCHPNKERKLAKQRECWPDNFTENFDEKQMDSQTCKHIRAANRYLANEVKRKIINNHAALRRQSGYVGGFIPRETTFVESGESEMRGVPEASDAGLSPHEREAWEVNLGGKVLAASV